MSYFEEENRKKQREVRAFKKIYVVLGWKITAELLTCETYMLFN